MLIIWLQTTKIYMENPNSKENHGRTNSLANDPSTFGIKMVKILWAMHSPNLRGMSSPNLQALGWSSLATSIHTNDNLQATIMHMSTTMNVSLHNANHPMLTLTKVNHKINLGRTPSQCKAHLGYPFREDNCPTDRKW